jgi:hypothetical protein
MIDLQERLQTLSLHQLVEFLSSVLTILSTGQEQKKFLDNQLKSQEVTQMPMMYQDR